MHISTPQPTANLEHSCAYHDYDKLDWYDYRWRPDGLKPGVFSYVLSAATATTRQSEELTLVDLGVRYGYGMVAIPRTVR